jgi:hypothetical protein
MPQEAVEMDRYRPARPGQTQSHSNCHTKKYVDKLKKQLHTIARYLIDSDLLAGSVLPASSKGQFGHLANARNFAAGNVYV